MSTPTGLQHMVGTLEKGGDARVGSSESLDSLKRVKLGGAGNTKCCFGQCDENG